MSGRDVLLIGGYQRGSRFRLAVLAVASPAWPFSVLLSKEADRKTSGSVAAASRVRPVLWRVPVVSLGSDNCVQALADLVVHLPVDREYHNARKIRFRDLHAHLILAKSSATAIVEIADVTDDLAKLAPG